MQRIMKKLLVLILLTISMINVRAQILTKEKSITVDSVDLAKARQYIEREKEKLERLDNLKNNRLNKSIIDVYGRRLPITFKDQETGLALEGVMTKDNSYMTYLWYQFWYQFDPVNGSKSGVTIIFIYLY